MNPFDVDQATADRWITDQRFTLFGEGEPLPDDMAKNEPHHNCTECGGFCALYEAMWAKPCPTCKGTGTVPPAWMVELAKPCETCGGWSETVYSGPKCPDCSNGQRRHPVTVPCGCTICDMRVRETHPRITVAHAIVEWGPAIATRDMEDVGSAYWGPACVEINPGTGYARRWPAWDGALDYDEGDDITPLPPDVDPASLVGQWAIGGRIEVAG